MAAATGAPVEVDDGWMETDFGEWEGLSFAEAMARWPDEVSAWLKDTSVPPPGGESFDATGTGCSPRWTGSWQAARPGRSSWSATSPR